MMRAATLFSGIGAPECAAPWFDWRWCAETDPFASAVHKARFPGVPNLGDVNAIRPEAVEPIDAVVFGSPCQSFSVAGKRLGLDDPRGNLALVALRLVGRLRPRWLVFENVPGLLSSDGGRDFGAFLGLLGECGYGFAYRVLDAQHFGVPQRRRRVFVVGYFGSWQRAAAVLFELESLRGDPAPRREAGERIAREPEARAFALGSHSGAADGDQTNRSHAGGGPVGSNISEELSYSLRGDRTMSVAHSFRADGFDASEDGTGRGNKHNWQTPEFTDTDICGNPVMVCLRCGHLRTFDQIDHDDEPCTGRETPIIAVDCYNGAIDGDVTHSARSGNGNALGGVPAVMTLAIRGRGDSHDLEYRDDGVANAILQPGGGRAGIGVGAVAINGANHADADEAGATAPLDRRSGVMTVRRLTPRLCECERLQGFPPGWTAIAYRGKPAADGPRYRALGNSVAVPVVRWILRRIAECEAR